MEITMKQFHIYTPLRDMETLMGIITHQFIRTTNQKPSLHPQQREQTAKLSNRESKPRMENNNFIVPSQQLDLSMLNQEEKVRFEEMVKESREHQEEFHLEWNSMTAEAKDDTLSIFTARKFWGLEWALSQINILCKPLAGLSQFQTGELRHQLEVVSHQDPPTIQMTGGPFLCMIRVYTVKGRQRFTRNWLTLESLTSKLRKLRFLLHNLRMSSEVETVTMLEDLRALTPKMVLIGNQPYFEENLAEKQSLTIARIHPIVEKVRVFAGYYQRPEEHENWVKLEMLPAWGQAAQLWEEIAWTRHSDQISDLVASYPLPEGHAETMNNKTVISWNIRGAGNPNFLRSVRDVVVRYNPNILILTETRIPKDRAPYYLSRLPFDQWFATDTQGFRGGIWLAWNSTTANITVLSATVQEIHALVSTTELPGGGY